MSIAMVAPWGLRILEYVETEQIIQNKIEMNKKVILPCPFCGEIPVLERQYLPASLCLSCKNDNCYVNPAIEITVFCKQNSDGFTFAPQFEQHENEIIEKWNKRNV